MSEEAVIKIKAVMPADAIVTKGSGVINDRPAEAIVINTQQPNLVVVSPENKQVAK